MNKTVMQSIRTCCYLHILTFVIVVMVHYNVNDVTFSTIRTLKISNILLNSLR